jgi:hypothetical protein
MKYALEMCSGDVIYIKFLKGCFRHSEVNMMIKCTHRMGRSYFNSVDHRV